MNHAKIAWWLSVVYTIGAMGFFASDLDQEGLGRSLILLLMIFHAVLLAIFFLAYKMQVRFFAFVSMTWFCFGFFTLLGGIQTIASRYDVNSDGYAIGGAFTALGLMAIMIYLSIRIVLANSVGSAEKMDESSKS